MSSKSRACMAVCCMSLIPDSHSYMDYICMSPPSEYKVGHELVNYIPFSFDTQIAILISEMKASESVYNLSLNYMHRMERELDVIMDKHNLTILGLSKKLALEYT